MVDAIQKIRVNMSNDKIDRMVLECTKWINGEIFFSVRGFKCRRLKWYEKTKLHYFHATAYLKADLKLPDFCILFLSHHIDILGFNFVMVFSCTQNIEKILSWLMGIPKMNLNHRAPCIVRETVLDWPIPLWLIKAPIYFHFHLQRFCKQYASVYFCIGSDAGLVAFSFQ